MPDIRLAAASRSCLDRRSQQVEQRLPAAEGVHARPQQGSRGAHEEDPHQPGHLGIQNKIYLFVKSFIIRKSKKMFGKKNSLTKWGPN